tara:strand:- start:58 stop:573 length:516 start_codon:yes stop_codon:yes gene_type:complete
MSDKKDFVEFVDFQRMVEELEKIQYEANLGSVKSNFAKLEKMAVEEAKEDLERIFSRATEKGLKDIDGVPKPLTVQESKAFDQKYKEAQEEVDLVKRKIKAAKKLLKKGIDKEKGYTMSLEKRGKIRKIAKRFYGEKKNSITFEDYQLAREIRDSFNKKEGLSFFKKEEDE